MEETVGSLDKEQATRLAQYFDEKVTYPTKYKRLRAAFARSALGRTHATIRSNEGLAMECSLPVTFIRNVKADMQNPFVRMRCDVCLFCSARCRGGSEGIEVTWRRSRVSRGGGFAPSCIRTSENSPSETVRKGLLREWLGRVPNMRKAYQTDPSDAEWS